MSAIPLDSLSVSDAEACEQLRDALITERYAVIAINQASIRETLVQAVNQFEPEKTFRFPARDGVSHYDEVHKACFKALYDVAISCTKALWSAVPALNASFPGIAAKVQQVETPEFQLFSGQGGNSPFAALDAPFAHTFFNIFNYDHGMLNEHQQNHCQDWALP